MTTATPGYNRVRSDSRRAIIPDLPVDAYPVEDGDTHDRLASTVFVSYFAALLAGGIALWLAFAS
jgi:hypothetical protein